MSPPESVLDAPPAAVPLVDVGADERLENLLDERTRALLEKRRLGNGHRRGWLVRRALAAADVVGLVVAFAIAQIMFSEVAPGVRDRVPSWLEVLLFAATMPVWILLARAYHLYDKDEERTDHSTVDDFVGVFNMVTVGAWVFFGVTTLTGVADPNFRKLFSFWVAAVALVGLGRAIARTLCRRSDTYIQNTLIIGAGYVGQRVAHKLMQHPEYGVNLIGFVDEHPRARDESLGELTVLGTVAELPTIVRALDVERVIVAFSQHPHGKTLGLIRTLNDLDVQVDIVPRLFEVIGPNTTLHAAEGLPLLGLSPPRLSRSSLMLKRAMDVALSAIGLVLLLPVFAVVAVVIKLDSTGPVLFRQKRMGRGQQTFEIWKCRTMAVDAESQKSRLAHLNKHADGDDRMFKIPDDPRVTRVGRFLRRTSIDELPQLVNVLKGEMSLVGPRPIVLEEHAHVDGWANRRLDLTPGITGLWQTLGRDDIPFGEMLGLDYQYVTSWSLAGDLKIIARTIPALRQRSSA